MASLFHRFNDNLFSRLDVEYWSISDDSNHLKNASYSCEVHSSYLYLKKFKSSKSHESNEISARCQIGLIVSLK